MNAHGHGFFMPEGQEGRQSSVNASARPKKKRLRWVRQLRHFLTRLFLPFKNHIPPNGVTPTEAVTSFLSVMVVNAGRTSPAWVKLLGTGLEDCALGYDARHDFFEVYPVEDYYFAGTVALEAARVRALYPPAQANAVMAEIGAQVDAAAKRKDRVISQMVFEIIGKINMSQGPTLQKMPYDKVTKTILEHLDIRKNESTRPLMFDKGFRHALGEPLAVGFRNWWAAFQTSFVLYVPPEEDDDDIDDEDLPVSVTAPMPIKRPWRPRRATTF